MSEAPRMPETGGSVIKSVTRVFEVLELFERRKAPLTSSQVSRQLGYPASSALALLKSMVELGYLSSDAFEKTYFPTVRLTIVGQWIERAAHLGDSHLTTVVEALIGETGESVALSCQNDLAMQFVYTAQGPQHVTHNVVAGTPAPLFHSSIGLVALSGRTDAEIARLVERHNRTVRSRVERVVAEAVVETVGAIRERGWFAGYDMYMPGVSAIAWLLPSREGVQGTVLSVSGPTDRLRAHEAEIVAAVPAALRHYGLLLPEPLRQRG